MKYTTEKNLKEILTQLDMRLSAIEVKGDSVQNLFHARLLIKDLFENLEEIEEKKDGDD